MDERKMARSLFSIFRDITDKTVDQIETRGYGFTQTYVFRGQDIYEMTFKMHRVEKGDR